MNTGSASSLEHQRRDEKTTDSSAHHIRGVKPEVFDECIDLSRRIFLLKSLRRALVKTAEP